MTNAISFRITGDFKKTDVFLKKIFNQDPVSIMNHYGALGVERLREATPRATGLTAASWSYSVEKTSTGYQLSFSNSNRSEGIPIVILLQYGHGTRGGTWVEGIDFINPALRPIFLELSKALREEVVNGSKN